MDEASSDGELRPEEGDVVPWARCCGIVAHSSCLLWLSSAMSAIEVNRDLRQALVRAAGDQRSDSLASTDLSLVAFHSSLVLIVGNAALCVLREREMDI